jgi:hypothetical protein
MFGRVAKHAVGIPLVLFLLSASIPGAQVSPRPQSGGEKSDRVKVVGKLALPGMHVNSMFLQQRGDQIYLYLHRPNRRAFALVDVTKPASPVLLDPATLPQEPGGRVEMVHSETALAVSMTPEASPGVAAAPAPPAVAAPEVKLPTETVTLIDIAEPKSPRTILTFNGVTSMLPDQSRRLLFIVNNDGLWVVHHREINTMEYCDSSAAVMIQPHCQ